MYKHWRQTTDRSLKLISLLVSVALLLGVAPHSFASDDFLDGRYDRLSDSGVSAVATHQFGMQLSNIAVPVGSINFRFCSNSPIIEEACTAPNGLDLSGATLSAQQGEIGFSIATGSPSNEIIVTRPAALPNGSPSVYTFDNIINPNTAGSYYVRLQTFTSIDATGANVEQGGTVFAITSGIHISAEVPPYLKLCASVTITNYDCTTATSYFIDMGEFSTSKATAASSQLVVATNAGYGYSVTVAGTTLTSGNNTIPASATGRASSPGTSQFGINLRSNASPLIGADPVGPGVGVVTSAYAVPNTYLYKNGDVIVMSTNSSGSQKFTLSYVTNVSPSQAAGYYVTTLTYICLANF